MSNWNGAVLTKKGLALQARVEAGETKLNLTKLKLGDGTPTDLENMTDLARPVQVLGITSVQAKADGTVVVNGLVSNTDLAEGYYLKEFGLFAKDDDDVECLYCVTTDSNPDYMPADGSVTAISTELGLTIAISNTDKIVVKPSAAGLVTSEDLADAIEGHNEDDEAHQDIRDLIAEAGSGGSATYFYVDGTYTVPEGVTEIYVSGCAGGAGGGVCGGGAGQSVYRRKVTVTAGQTISITIGTGGAGYWDMPRTSNGSYGSWDKINNRAGGNTVFGSFFTLTGGKASAYVSGDDAFGGIQVSQAGGAGGTNGQRSTMMCVSSIASNSLNVWDGGRGGDSLFGRGGSGGMFVMKSASAIRETVNATSGIGYGSGGGGLGWYVGSSIRGYTDAGDGANGIIIIETA